MQQIKKGVILLLLALLILPERNLHSQTQMIEQSELNQMTAKMRVDPPNWFVGMEEEQLHLLVHAKNVSDYSCALQGSKGIVLDTMTRLPNPDYAILELIIDSKAPPQEFIISLTQEDDELAFTYELLQKKAKPKKIDGGDVLYLIMPDRFANGDPSIDNVEGMSESLNRAAPGGKHGGDIQGVIDHLDYLKYLGVTTVWLNPVYENNMKKYSYHGYSITDHYQVDPRLGSLDTYARFCELSHERGMKVVKDMIFNHIGLYHHWMDNMPDPDWLNQWDEFTRTNYSGSTVTDPYASDIDQIRMTKGWFDVTMPDLNQKNPALMKYLTQHSIWWIEMTGIDGIRMDTYPYPDKHAMAKWVDDVLKEYPGFYIVGETWLYTPVQLAFWTKSNLESNYSSNLPSVSDFGVTWAIDRAFREEKGIWELYQILTNDFIYDSPNNFKIFVDNHDMDRSLAVYENDVDKFLMAYTFLLTTRGIPQFFYGTEIGMTGKKPDGLIREDMPGGWNGDVKNVFTQDGLSDQESKIFNYLRRLMTWRRSKSVFAHDNLVHFMPVDEVYVYGRQHAKEAIVVILNNSDKERKINMEHYGELFKGFRFGFEILTNRNIVDFDKLVVPAKTSFVIDLKK